LKPSPLFHSSAVSIAEGVTVKEKRLHISHPSVKFLYTKAVHLSKFLKYSAASPYTEKAQCVIGYKTLYDNG
jgi:hypothetical protein